MSERSRTSLLERLNAGAPRYGKVEHLESIEFGQGARIERYRFENGLELLYLPDHSAPVLAYHTWFRVGSRHERPGKTGLAHLFEHLMFNEVEGLPPGGFDRKMEAAGADNNASTWLDFTQYQEAFPKGQLALVAGLEARRMNTLVLQQPQLDSEKEVVMNERRMRVEDDVEGAVDELLWKTAFDVHPYRWPTIGWMSDIEGFTTGDCLDFYRTYYAPNNACLVVVGDVTESKLLTTIAGAYGEIPPSTLPIEDIHPEPRQQGERRVEVEKPTPTEKLLIGYRGPALGDPDHLLVSLLMEVLCGGRASRLHKRLVRELSLASDLRASVGPHRDPSLIDIFVSAREGHRAEELLAIVDEELERLVREPVGREEIERATARAELGLLSGLETADGKASTIGFYETVLRRPAAPFERLRAMRWVEPGDLWRAARRYLRSEERTLVLVRPQAEVAA
ncbi:MAG TPA: pitrilysin family protein [Polyangiaceae bacterium]|nr:pitrilysin family protein [Polyangiaceae bacterium]